MMPSAPAVVEDEDNNDNVMPSYLTHWPKKLATLPTPTYDLLIIPPPAFLTCLGDLDRDELIRLIYCLKNATTPTPNVQDDNSTTPADATNVQGAPKELECMSEEDIRTHLHHSESCFPPIRPCDTPNASNSKQAFAPEELHCLTSCHCF